MFATMTDAAPFDSDAPDGTLRPIIRYKPDGSGKKEVTGARWGTDPRFNDGVGYRFIRAEGKAFPARRCLLPASEFHMKVGAKRYRAALDDGNFFYLAGVWEQAIDDWPLAFRIITVAANAEVSRYQERHGAIVLRREAAGWLDGTLSEASLLVTPPARTFVIEELGAAHTAQRSFAL